MDRKDCFLPSESIEIKFQYDKLCKGASAVMPISNTQSMVFCDQWEPAAGQYISQQCRVCLIVRTIKTMDTF